MKTVAQLLNAKQNQQVYTIGPDEMVLDALRLMAEKNIGALLVVNHGEVVGVVSERDYARKMVLKGRSSIGTPISAIMSAPVVSVDSKQSVDTCMNLMTDRHLRHLSWHRWTGHRVDLSEPGRPERALPGQADSRYPRWPAPGSDHGWPGRQLQR